MRTFLIISRASKCKKFLMNHLLVAQVLQQAAGISVQTDNTANFEMLDYIVSLREGIMDAWGGIIIAMRAGNKSMSRYPTHLQRATTDRDFQLFCSNPTLSRFSSCCRPSAKTRTALSPCFDLLWASSGTYLPLHQDF